MALFGLIMEEGAGLVVGHGGAGLVVVDGGVVVKI